MARAGALQADGRAGRTAEAAGALESERESGDTTMLACDTEEGPAATRPRLLRHGASARSARAHARPGLACWLGQLGQVGALCTWLSSGLVFGPV